MKGNRTSLQGRPKVLKGGRSQTMCYSYPFTLARRAVVVTLDLAARNIHMLASDHRLSNPRNVVVLRLSAPSRGREGDAGVPHELTNREQMSQWSVEEVMDFMKANDLEGPGGVLVANGVRGQDLLVLEEDDLRNDLKLSRFATQRVLTARDTFLQH